ncbi:MAG: NRDE family protein [Alphaproteobacteria bacterium]|nr:NRDE family protein [Alphaproteobacteria bacterium]MBF0129805.1 NRDE family protein [Alphaproteobacteria bacterium]
MCSIVILARPGHPWPVLIGANRDEMAARPWRPPARHWPDRADVVAGLDELAGGSWLGANDHGVVAAILNRHGTLGPAAGKRSRGELVLEALDHADAADAAGAMGDLDPAAYRPFNMMITDNRDAFWISCREESDPRPIRVVRVPPGLSMLTAFDLDDGRDPRIRGYLPRFRAAPVPEPDRDDWASWRALLGSRGSDGPGPEGAMCFLTDSGFGTSSSSLIALPSMDAEEARPRWLFAAGPPDRTPYFPVDF